MTNADKKTLRARLVKLAQLAKKKLGIKDRYWFVVRMADGGSGVYPIAAEPTLKGWTQTKELLQRQGYLDQLVMACVVDATSGQVVKRGYNGDSETFEYVTPKWEALRSIPGIAELWRSRIATFRGMVLPWAS